jgi:hypothetical protein
MMELTRRVLPVLHLKMKSIQKWWAYLN